MADQAGPSFYRRELPLPAVAFSSAEGRALFREALAAGTMECYFTLAEQLHTQAEPAFCGLATLVMVLNALAVDPGVVWKGPWRWYHEGALECCKPLAEVKVDGITFDEWLCLAKCHGLVADGVRAPACIGERAAGSAADGADIGAGEDADAGAEFAAFIAAIETHARDASGSAAIVVSYSRQALGQTGDGHFSPLGGFHRERGLVLILDTARFKYPPHWVPARALWAGMRRVDPSTGRSRGYVRLRRADTLHASACLRLSLTPDRLVRLCAALEAAAAPLCSDGGGGGAGGGAGALARLRALARALPADVSHMLQLCQPPPDADPGAAAAGGCLMRCTEHGSLCSHAQQCAVMLAALRRSRVYLALRAEAEAAPLIAAPETLAALLIVLARAGVLHGPARVPPEGPWARPLAVSREDAGGAGSDGPPPAGAAAGPAELGDVGMRALEAELDHLQRQTEHVMGMLTADELGAEAEAEAGLRGCGARKRQCCAKS